MDASRYRPTFLTQALMVCFSAVALYMSLWLFQASLPHYLPTNWAAAHELDALVDWKGARLALMGRSPYTPEGLREIGAPLFGHPPTTPFWFLPLAPFVKALAAELISLGVWFGLIIHLGLTLRELRYPAPIILTTLLTSMVLSTTWMVHHFHVIQLSEHIAVAYVVAWVCLRRNHDTAAGVALGIATSLKLFPGLVILFLLLGRRFRTVVASGLTFLAISATMAFLYGPESWLMFFKQQGPNAVDWVGYIRNSSIHGIISRMGTPICTGDSLPSRWTTVAAVGASVVLVGLTWLAIRRRMQQARTEDARAIDVPFALLTLLSVFLNAWAWEHYYVFLLQPLLVLLATFTSHGRDTLRRWCDEEIPRSKLARGVGISVIGIVGVLVFIPLLRQNMWHKEGLLDLWMRTRKPWYHTHVHIVEVLNWLPWVLGLALSFLAVPLWRRPRTEP